MLFDFKATYASYTNEQLAQIAGNEDGYQPAAVAAAKALLEERGITGENLQDMLFPRQPETAAATGMPQYEDGKTSIFEEMYIHAISPAAKRKRNIISIWMGVNAVYILGIWSYSRILSWNFRPYGYTFLSFLTIVFPLLYTYLLFIRHKWARPAAIVYGFYMLTSLVQGTITSLPYIHYRITAGNITIFGWSLYIAITHTVILTLLNSKDMKTAHPASRKMMIRATGIGVFIYLFDQALHYITYHRI